MSDVAEAPQVEEQDPQDVGPPDPKRAKLLGVLDVETDPFDGTGKRPEPFAWGLLLEQPAPRYARGAARVVEPLYLSGWATSAYDCRKAVADALKAVRKTHIVYVHNLAFDQPVLAERSGGKLVLRDGHVLECRIGGCLVRDSFAILPVPLAKLNAGKLSIDFAKLHRKVRAKHQAEIMAYLEADCRATFKAVAKARDLIGRGLTIGACAKSWFTKAPDMPTVGRLGAGTDAYLRPYYHGGRVQVFARGAHVGVGAPLAHVDANSAYPSAMASERHPVGGDGTWYDSDDITVDTAFLTVRGVSYGAFPFVPKDHKPGLTTTSYPDATGQVRPMLMEYRVTIHEWLAAVETKTFDTSMRGAGIVKCENCSEWADFAPYVRHWYGVRQAARAAGDGTTEAIAKLMLNSLYGKFGTRPVKYDEWWLQSPSWGAPPDDEQEGADGVRPNTGWVRTEVNTLTRCTLWRRPAEDEAKPWNCATAASITGAVRAQLWRAICAADRPLYCDTDSLVAHGVGQVRIGDALGEWKVESRPDVAVLLDRKLYALGHQADAGAWEWCGVRYDFDKVTCRGAIISAPEMVEALGVGELRWTRQAPALDPTGKATPYTHTAECRL
jgi:hypothetical protein